MTEIESAPAYYAIIPASVRYDKTLTANAKLLYGEITALCNEKGYCWASNAYFAKLYNMSRIQTISEWISALSKAGYIDVAIDSNTHQERKIYMTEPLRKNVSPLTEKRKPPLTEKRKHNNTSLNNTSNKAKAYPLVDAYALEDSAITDAGKELLCKYVDYRKKVKSSLKTTAPLKAFLAVMREAVKQGFKPNEIFELMESKEWLTVKIEWIIKELAPTKQTPSNMTYEQKIAFRKEELPNGGYIDWFGDVRDSMGYTK